MDFTKLMAQANEMQKQMGNIEEELQNKLYEATIGGGVVKVSLRGTMQIESIFIDPSILKEEEQPVVEEMVQMAINDVLEQAKQDRESSMSSLSAGMDISGLL